MADPATQNAALSEAIQALHFPEIAQRYRLIDQDAIQVVVPWLRRIDEYERLREQAMDILLRKSTLQLPQSLIDMEIERLRKSTEADMQSKGVQTINLSADMFKAEAARRVSLGLILAEIVQKHQLIATPAQIRAIIEEQAQSYETPDEVMQWYYQNPERMREVESLALEESVVTWLSGQAQVEDISTTFDELMGRT